MLAVLQVSAIVLLCLGNTPPAAGAVWRDYGATNKDPLNRSDKHAHDMVLEHGFNVGAKATSEPPADKAVYNQVSVVKVITSHVVDATNVSGEGRLTGGGNMTAENDVTTLLGNGTTAVHYDLSEKGGIAVHGVDNVVEARFSSNVITKDSSLTTPSLGRSDKTVNLVISPGANIRHGISGKGDKLAIYSPEDAHQPLFGGNVNARPNILETSFPTGTTFARPSASDTILHNSPYAQDKTVRIHIGGNVNAKSSDVGGTPDHEKAVKLVISGDTPKGASGYMVGHKDSSHRQAPLGGNANANNYSTSFRTGPEKMINLQVVTGGTSISRSASSKGDETLSPYGPEKAVRIQIGGNLNSVMPMDLANTRGIEKTVKLVIPAKVPKGIGGTKDTTFPYDEAGNLIANSLTTPFGAGPHDTERAVNVFISGGSDRKGNQALQNATKPHIGHFDNRVTTVGDNFDRVTNVTLLHQVETIGIFTSHGRNFSDVDHNGNYPLHTVVRYENANKTLLEGGANFNAKNRESETPLDIASSRDHAGVIKVLLSSGANPNQVNARGGTPLHTASWHGQVNAVNALLDGGSDVKARNNDSQTPLHTATSRDHAQVVSLLLSRGANPNDRNDSGDTPLHTAARYGQQNAAKALIDGGADINAKNFQGKTALQVATARGNHNVGSLLFNREQNDRASAIDVRSNNNAMVRIELNTNTKLIS